MADALGMLQAALASVPNSTVQAEHLGQLKQSLERNPMPLKVLAPLLLAKTAAVDEWLMRGWVLEILLYALAKSVLSIDDKSLLATQAMEPLGLLLVERQHDHQVVKSVIQIFTAIYPILFRHLCLNRNNPQLWQSLSSYKSRILDIFSSTQAPVGVKISALKFAQRVLLVDTRGVSDPRLQSKLDPSISMCPADHPFIHVSQLEAEGGKILEGIISLLYTNSNVELLSALLNSWVNLAKLRPNMTTLIVDSLRHWQPTALANSPASDVRSVEKCLRVVLSYISRLPTCITLVPQINEALQQQALRMDRTAEVERKRRAEGKKRPLPPGAATSDAKRPKLEGSATPSPTDPAGILASFDFTTLPAPLITELIIASLQHLSEPTLIGLVQAYRQNKGLDGVANGAPSTVAPSASSAVPTTADRSTTPPAPPPKPPVKLEPIDPLKMDIDQDEMEFEPERINDQLSGGVPIEEIETQALATAASLNLDISLTDFQLPPPSTLSEPDRLSLVHKSMVRIREAGLDLRHGVGIQDDELEGLAAGSSPAELWVLLVVRMITRVVYPSDVTKDSGEKDAGTKEEADEEGQAYFYERQDQLRQKLCDYIMQDFSGRIRFATAWMNEEWYNDQLRLRQKIPWRPNYEIWLNQIVARYQALLEGKDRTFSRFLLDLPSIPPDVLDLLREFCVDCESPERMQIGFITLRGFVSQRPSLRAVALPVLLELTTHAERKIRGAAINTVKLWVPNHPTMDVMIRAFAQQLLRKLQPGPTGFVLPKPEQVEDKLVGMNGGSEVNGGELKANGKENGDAAAAAMSVEGEESKESQPSMMMDGVVEESLTRDDNMEDGQITPEELIQTPYLPDRIQLPAQKPAVLQHVELLFALCVKAPDLLDEIFASYGGMDVTVQEAIQDLITALIKSLGPNHGKLLTLLRTFPPGAESLALRIIRIFTDNARPTAQIVALVKGLVTDRGLDARFLIPIIGEMDKADILRHLPKIVSMLNGQAEPKNLVKSVFSSIVTTPPQTFGSVSSNLPRVRQSELLTPAELMVLLHDSEKEIGVRSAIEAIGVCFSMTDVYRSEILAVVMQQIVDEPVLPVLFMRTVIQAVTTYKSLIGFVSTTLFSRLITKKIWTTPLLWEGFIRCAKVIAPASFGALLQLPKDQLRELVEKQPTLKTGLREFVSKKPANNKARVAGFLDILGGEEQGDVQMAGQTTTGSPASNSPSGTPAPMVVETPPPPGASQTPPTPSMPEVSS